jgi:hypothetical protein
MKKLFKQFWHWLKYEDENGNPITTDTFPFIEIRNTGKYSELIQRFPIDGKIGDDDILQLSHKLENGKYETCYVTISQLKQVLKGN